MVSCGIKELPPGENVTGGSSFMEATLQKFHEEREVPLIPARMLNEFAYCPRLAYLEWVQGEFEDNVDTVEGRFRHRNVDEAGGKVEAPGEKGPEEGEPEQVFIHARSLLLSSHRLGAIAKIDLLEGEGLEVSPVDYKKGEVPDTPQGAWEPERVQIGLQGLILRDNGFSCRQGVIYYVASKKRVIIPLTEELEKRTLELLDQFRKTVAQGTIPAPLEDSRKCIRCSLVGICLPDEVNYLSRLGETEEGEKPEVRRLYPARDDALAVYVQTQGASISKEGDVLKIKNRGEVLDEVRLLDVSQLNIIGNIQVSTQAIRELCEREIPICYFSYGGRFYGLTQGMAHKNIMVRRAQFKKAEDQFESLSLARRFVEGKILNSRTLLRRNHEEVPERVLRALGLMAQKAAQAGSTDELLGIEGTAANIYFGEFAGMIKNKGGIGGFFDFENRNRRPPRDPVNALLSLAYSLLTKDMTVILLAVGLDPYLGFYHVPRYGRPALALDLIEEFRPLVADSVVISAINNGEIEEKDFIQRAGAVSLTDPGRRKFLEAYERRMDNLITHPIFGYRISYRRVLEVQARLLARYLLGEIKEYPPFRTR